LRRSKFRNIKIILDGLKFDSKAESRRYIELKEIQENGGISKLNTQEKFIVIPKQDGERSCTYIADFTYIKDGVKVVEDVKSKATITPQYIIKRKLMLYIHNIKINEILR